MIGRDSKSPNPTEEDGKKEERQIGELFSAVKKQMALIHVLKKQKVHIIASTIFKYCEEEFEKLLELGKDK